MNITKSSISRATHLSCSQCNETYDLGKVQTFSHCCSKPLLVNYSSEIPLNKEDLVSKETTMWRYANMLPLFKGKNKISLGEGMTPILPWSNLAAKYGLRSVLLKDEGLNPTGSFKARGMSMAVSKALEFGIEELVVPTAGNAGGALSAYCAVAGQKATVVMPKNTPLVFKEECEQHGANLILVDGLIDDCGRVAADIQMKTGAFNMATMKEPYRLEGKKTMGYEIAEQMEWSLPDVIIYPTGGGTGLIGIWKAFLEMIQLGWIQPDRLPRMIAVQSSSCPPIVNLFHGKKSEASSYCMSIANGLSVPVAFGQDMIMNVLHESNGTAISISDQKILAGVVEIGSSEGILISPEGAAVWEALKALISKGQIRKDEQVMLLNTGSGFKYLENYR